MSMKIVVLISGEYRKFDMCRPTMKFLDDPRVDVYISVWDTTRYVLPLINLDATESVDDYVDVGTIEEWKNNA